MQPYLDRIAQISSKKQLPNVLEQFSGEVKHRADVVGIFANENVITRLVGIILLEQNGKYEIQKR